MLLDGIYVALTTPFYRDGRLYVRKVEHNVDRFSKTPAAGLIALGPNGEIYVAGTENAEVALVPRLDGRYSPIGTRARIEQVSPLVSHLT